jgi:hypothetical protein
MEKIMTVKGPPGFAVSFKTHLGPAGEAEVDAWELEAARRAVLNLKTLLHDQPMMELLKPQMDAADASIKNDLAKSKGEWRLCRVDGRAEGLTSEKFFGWMMANMRPVAPGSGATPEERLAACLKGYAHHPEHYVVPPGKMGIVETMGGMPTRMEVRPGPLENAPQFVKDDHDPSYTQGLYGHALLEDGTIPNYAYHQFRDTDGGCDFILRVWFPASADRLYGDQHAQHFAIEFRNFMHQAASELAAG